MEKNKPSELLCSKGKMTMKEMTVAHQLNDTNGEQAWNQSTIVSSGHNKRLMGKRMMMMMMKMSQIQEIQLLTVNGFLSLSLSLSY